MLDGLYKRRLLRDLDAWTDRGWISPQAAGHIRDSLGTASAMGRIPVVIGFLGAVLLAFAAMTFVAANWSDIPRIGRLALLLAALTASYAAAWGLLRTAMPRFADAAVLLGAAVFGATIMLVAQSYHIEADFPAGMLTWAAGALLAAWLGQSRGALALAVALFCLWSGYVTVEHGWPIHWQFLPAWALCLLVTEQLRWHPGRHLVILAGLYWLVLVILSLGANSLVTGPILVGYAVAVAAALFAAAHLLVGLPRAGPAARYGRPLAPYALAALLVAAFSLQLPLDGTPRPGAGALGALLALAAAAGIAGLLARARGRLSATDAALVALFALSPLPAVYGPVDEGGNPGLFTIAYIAVVMFAISVWAVAHGQARHHRASVSLGLIAFAGEALYLYFETFGELLDTALFFLVGGILLIVVAFVLYRLHRRLLAGAAAPGAMS